MRSRLQPMAAALLAVATLCCREADATTLEEDIRRLTIPPAAALLSWSPLQRHGWNAEASWELETSWTWEEYQSWVRPRMAGYTPTSEEAHMTFVRQLPGDLVRVTVERTSSGRPMHIRVVLVASAS